MQPESLKKAAVYDKGLSGFAGWKKAATTLLVLLAGICVFLYSPDTETMEGGLLLTVLAGAAFIDLYHEIIPNELILAGAAFWIFVALQLGEPEWAERLFSAGLSFVTVLLIRWAGEKMFGSKGMGIGDAKLVFIMALFLGWDVFWALYLSILAGGMWSLGGIILKKLDRRSRLPFAPFLLAGTCISLFLFPFETFFRL